MNTNLVNFEFENRFKQEVFMIEFDLVELLKDDPQMISHILPIDYEIQMKCIMFRINVRIMLIYLKGVMPRERSVHWRSSLHLEREQAPQVLYRPDQHIQRPSHAWFAIQLALLVPQERSVPNQGYKSPQIIWILDWNLELVSDVQLTRIELSVIRLWLSRVWWGTLMRRSYILTSISTTWS